MKGLQVTRHDEKNERIEDPAFMRTFALLVMMGDAMEQAQKCPDDQALIAKRFMRAALQTWGNSGKGLVESTKYMAEDLGYRVEVNEKVEVGNA